MSDGTDDAYDHGSHIAAGSGGTLDIYAGSIRVHCQDFVVPTPTGINRAPQMGSLTSLYSITSGALPTMGAWVSGTAKVNPVAQQIVVAVEVVTDGTANAATCAIAVSPDNSTYTTIATPGASAAVNTVGAITMLASVLLPQGWYIKLTFSHCTVASSKYY